jgi:hypothetical protein
MTPRRTRLLAVPTGAIEGVAAQLDAKLVVLGAARAELLAGADQLAALSTSRRICVGGRGASPALARRIGAERLPADPIAAADLVSAPPNP